MTGNAHPALEFVLLEMHMRSANLLQDGFEGALSEAIRELEGALIFNARLDDDEPFQRCAAVVLGQGQEYQSVALAFLARDGLSVDVEDAETSQHPLASEALEMSGLSPTSRS